MSMVSMEDTSILTAKVNPSITDMGDLEKGQVLMDNMDTIRHMNGISDLSDHKNDRLLMI